MFMYVAMMESESKTWMALGGTPEEAKNAILNEWNYLQKKMAKSGWIDEAEIFDSAEKLDNEYGIDVVKVLRGQCVSW